MKKLLSTLILTIFCISAPLTANASSEIVDTTLIKGYATAYHQTGIMRSGKYTRDGVCAGSIDYMNCVVVMYQRLPDGSIGDYIGTYECLDTGGTRGLRNGKVIDVWRPDLNGCQDFMDSVYEGGCNGKVYFQIIKKRK